MKTDNKNPKNNGGAHGARRRWSMPFAFGATSHASGANSRPLPRWRVGEHPYAPKAAAPMCFTPAALEELLRTVGSHPPESGAKGFGPKDRMGFDVVEFDVRGTERAGGAVYSPDVEWGEERRTHHLEQLEDLMRLWNGDLHSHPGGYGRPSRKSGPGLGDLGYVEEVFRANEWMQVFSIPILTFDADGTVVINPWVCHREDVHSPMVAELLVCEADDFPERPYNPAWLAAIGEAASTDTNAVDAPPLVEVVLDVTVPESTPEDGHVEVRGSHSSLGAWSSPGLILRRTDHRRYTGSITMKPGDEFLWKVTRGSWSTVEAEPDGRDTPNRSGTAAAGAPCIAEVHEWADRCGRKTDGPAATVAVGEDQSIERQNRGALTSVGNLPESRDALRAEYTKRQRGLLSDALGEKTILFVGLGAGSYMAEKAARLCPRRLKVCDYDVVEFSNLARTSYATDDVGLAKVDAFKRRAARINPLVEVEPYVTSLTEMSAAGLDELFDGVDLVVGGTDSFDAQALVNAEAARRRIPAVFIGIHARGDGGRVVWYVPGETGCYRCVAPERYEAAEKPAERGSLNLDGMVGMIVDCQFIDMVALKVVMAILERGQTSHYGRFYSGMQGRNDVVVRCHPEYRWGTTDLWDALLADLPSEPKDFARELKEEAFFSMDTVWLKGRREPTCSVCGSQAGKSSIAKKAISAYQVHQGTTNKER